ncbi:MAG: uracil-DNA glycosylase [Leptospiraceae bacterium]|nr:uracil-DNA glycosylase [Leptospiraceae bacterium]
MSNKLQQLKLQAESCIACKLATTRNRVVFGEGNPDARVMFIGEGPGRREDELGRPFVGRSGELLTRIIENGMKLSRESVYIANIVKCRPTVDMAMQKDRAPDQEEVAACSHFLQKQIELIQPEVIITLGGPSTKFILNSKEGITRLRGQWHSYREIPVMPTFHPSYILRNGGDKSPLKKDVWHDIQLVMKKLDENNPG